jgi:beta-lactam-binding protein with PASTA domain
MASAFDTPVTVPNLVTMAAAAVESACRTAGLVPQNLFYSNALGGDRDGGVVTAPVVASQVPAAAAVVGLGSTVRVNMGRGM